MQPDMAPKDRTAHVGGSSSPVDLRYASLLGTDRNGLAMHEKDAHEGPNSQRLERAHIDRRVWENTDETELCFRRKSGAWSP
jgi:hypothetical protein